MMYLVFLLANIFALGLVLLLQTMKVLARRSQFVYQKAGCYIKPLLVQCGLAALKSKDNPEIGNRYKNLKMRRGHKKAIIAIARFLMTVIYRILKDKVYYDERLYSHYNQLPTSKEITTEQAIALAKRQSYKIVC